MKNITNASRRNSRRQQKRVFPKIIKAATRYDVEGCEICGHQPVGREIYPIGKMGKRVVGVCHQHLRRLDTLLSMKFHFEGDENIRQRKLAEGVNTDGPAN
jgi:hypothetical protein